MVEDTGLPASDRAVKRLTACTDAWVRVGPAERIGYRRVGIPVEAGSSGKREPGLGGRVAEETLRLWVEQGGLWEFPVTGTSMLPILDRTWRIGADLSRRTIRFGDIVLFVWDGRLVVHRVVGRTAGGHRTRGDASKGFDPHPLREDEVLGVVTRLVHDDRAVDLEGTGSAALRFVLGSLSFAAGRLRIRPEGPRRGGSFFSRGRDAFLGPLYRGSLMGVFRLYVVISRHIPRRTASGRESA